MVEVRTVNEIWQQYLVLLLKNTYEYITLQQAKVEIFIVYADFYEELMRSPYACFCPVLVFQRFSGVY